MNDTKPEPTLHIIEDPCACTTLGRCDLHHAAPALLAALEALFDRGHAPREGRWPKRVPGGFGGIPAFAESTPEVKAAREAIRLARSEQS